MDLKGVQQQLKFILETDKEKEIYRQPHITGYNRQKSSRIGSKSIWEYISRMIEKY